jgi:hypothetical protein
MNKSSSMRSAEYVTLMKCLFSNFAETLEEIQLKKSKLTEKKMFHLTAGIFLGIQKEYSSNLSYPENKKADPRDRQNQQPVELDEQLLRLLSSVAVKTNLQTKLREINFADNPDLKGAEISYFLRYMALQFRKSYKVIRI